MIRKYQPVRLAPGEFFGDVVQGIDVDGLLLRETVHKPGQRIALHEHESPHFCLGISGSCTERVAGSDVSCVRGTLEFHPAGTRHSSRWDAGGGRCFTVTLGARWNALLPPSGRPGSLRAGILGAGSRQLMRRLHDELLAPDALTPVAVDGLMLALLASACREDRRTHARAWPSWLATVEEFLRAHACHSFRVADVAGAVGVHAAVVSRWFRRAHGSTIGEYVRELRVQRACELLVTTKDTLSQIATECGFADHAHLTRTFRRVKRCAPTEYRAAHK